MIVIGSKDINTKKVVDLLVLWWKYSSISVKNIGTLRTKFNIPEEKAIIDFVEDANQSQKIEIYFYIKNEYSGSIDNSK